MKKLSLNVVGATLLFLVFAPVANTQDENPPVSDGIANTPVSLGTAGDFALLAKTSIVSNPSSLVIGDMGISPAGVSSISGFSLTPDFTNKFATSSQVVGEVYAPDYFDPTPSKLTAAIADMDAAYADAAGRPANITELGGGSIGGMTLAPGVYSWTADLFVGSDITLTGDGTDVWIFQIGEDLLVGNGTRIRLVGGVDTRNVVWQVVGSVTIEADARFEGIVLGGTTISALPASLVHGGLLSKGDVNVDNTTVVKTFPQGTSIYGTGTPGCFGTIGMNASEAPVVGTSEFALLATNAPINALGGAILSSLQDEAGTFFSEIGILLHVNFIDTTDYQIFGVVSRPLGLAVGRIPIPNESSLVGQTFYAQTFWFEPVGESCGGSPIGLISSNGLVVTILPSPEESK
jgi:hypothetical protein